MEISETNTSYLNDFLLGEVEALDGLNNTGSKQLEITFSNVEWDPYNGELIDNYIFFLEDGSRWSFYWDVYESNDLSLTNGDVVEVKQTSKNNFLMTITTKDGDIKEVGFKKTSSHPCSYYTPK